MCVNVSYISSTRIPVFIQHSAPLTHPFTIFPKTLHPGSQTTEHTSFLNAFAHIITWCMATYPQAVVTQELLMLWCLLLSGEPSPNRFIESRAAMKSEGLGACLTLVQKSEFLTLSGSMTNGKVPNFLNFNFFVTKKQKIETVLWEWNVTVFGELLGSDTRKCFLMYAVTTSWLLS